MRISFQKKIANSIIQKSFVHNQFGYPSFTDYWHIICIKITPGADERAKCVHRGGWGVDSTIPQVHPKDPCSQRGPLPRIVCPQRTTNRFTGVTSGAQATSPRVSLRARGQEFELETERVSLQFLGGAPNLGPSKLEPSNLGAVKCIESLERQTGPTAQQWQSRRPYSYTVPGPSCTQCLYPPRSPPWPIPEPPSQNPAPEIFLPSLSRAISLHDRLPPTWAPRGSLHIQRLITALFQIVRRLLQGSGSLRAPPHVWGGWIITRIHPFCSEAPWKVGSWGLGFERERVQWSYWPTLSGCPLSILCHIVERLSQQRLGDICLLRNKGQSRCQPGFSVVSQDPTLPLQCPDPSKRPPILDPVMNLSKLRKTVKDRGTVLGVTKSRTSLSHWTVKQQQQKWGREWNKNHKLDEEGAHRRWIFWNWLKNPPWGRKGAPARNWVVELQHFNLKHSDA